MGLKNFGINGMKLTFGDVNLNTKNLDFTDLNANVKTQKQAQKINANLANISTQNIDINAFGKQISKILSLNLKDAKFDGENLHLSSINLGKSDVISAKKSFAGFKQIALSDIKFEPKTLKLALKNAKIDSLFYDDFLSKNGAKNINDLAIFKQDKTKNTNEKQSKSDFVASVENIDFVNAKAKISQNFLGENLGHEIILKKAKISNFSSDFTKAFDLDLNVATSDGLDLNTKGKLALSPLIGDVNAKLNFSDLSKLNKILATALNAKISGGTSSLDAKIKMDKNIKASANFILKNFVLNDLNSTKLASINELKVKNINYDKNALQISDILADSPFVKLHIFADKSLNFTKIVKNSQSDKDEKKADDSKDDFSLILKNIFIIKGAIDFSDDSLVLPFLFNIKNLNSKIDKIAPNSYTQINSQGTIGSGGSASINVKSEIFDYKKSSELKLAFKDVELNELTPYTATFVGRKIDSGLLDVMLDYSLKQSKLNGKNEIRIDTIKLGEEVKAPQAMNLPLGLAISVLQDSNNIIKLNLPISGDVDNPEFSYGSIVAKAILQVFTDVVTSPFRLLGNMFGIENPDELSGIDFVAGRSRFLQSQQKKLEKFKSISESKNDMIFTITPSYDENADLLALKKFKFDKEVRFLSRTNKQDESEVIEEMAKKMLKNTPKDAYDELVKLQKVEQSELEELAKKRANNLLEAMINAGVPSKSIVILQEVKKVKANMDTYVAIPMGISNKK
ncbi:MAG: DUF748 domain-containing protein [Campylobacter sp.]|nr:DUF748 domain-containing protein [Campylobacter sp.]